ncbi:hypothetical protein [Streptosporangium nondiastaticum]|nr:hypothetical protein [Streptosporangium nondiastaticum]
MDGSPGPGSGKPFLERDVLVGPDHPEPVELGDAILGQASGPALLKRC